jgi:hypothetical protein
MQMPWLRVEALKLEVEVEDEVHGHVFGIVGH